MKIACWNVNSLNVRLQHVCDWSTQHTPDVLCLQETKTIDEKFPIDVLSDIGYQVKYSGQKTYNGVAVMARKPLHDVVTDFPDFEDPQRRILAATCEDVRIINVYVPNGKQVGDEKYDYKLRWFKHLVEFVRAELDRYSKLVVTGDFNIAPADEDVHDPELWKGKILCSEPERESFNNLLNLGLTDSFRLFDQPPKSFSWWDYRAAGFRRDLGLRIDHVVVSDEMKQACTGCLIDKEPRKWERPSDHTPVMAQFAM